MNWQILQVIHAEVLTLTIQMPYVHNKSGKFDLDPIYYVYWIEEMN